MNTPSPTQAETAASTKPGGAPKSGAQKHQQTVHSCNFRSAGRLSNEDARTLTALHESAQSLGVTYEIVVANDTSTDRTAAIALEHRARVVAVNRRKIAATRNAGASAGENGVVAETT